MTLLVKNLLLQPYATTWQLMQQFTATRTPLTCDELWVVQHPPVYTQGQAGKAEHILNRSDIPIIQSDRGGQVTYHGPGQLVVYVLVDVKRRQLSVRCLVSLLEQAVINLLQDLQIIATSRRDAPGVYIEDKKVCSIGLRIKRGYSYHGLALNVAMDLTPFTNINPCGYKDLKMTQLSDYCENLELSQVAAHLITHLTTQLNHYGAARC